MYSSIVPMKALYLSVLPALLLAPLTSAVTTASNGVTCRLKAVLKFPEASEGVHKDSVQVLERKAGGEGKVCSSENQRTSWGCTHHGDAFFNATAGVRTKESARVFNAVGKQFVLRVSHDIIEEDVLRNPTATANSPERPTDPAGSKPSPSGSTARTWRSSICSGVNTSRTQA